jgi:hypothetical protein
MASNFEGSLMGFPEAFLDLRVFRLTSSREELSRACYLADGLRD